MSSAAFNSITSLQYSDVSHPLPPVPALNSGPDLEVPLPIGVPEIEVQRRVAAACAAERATVEQRLRQEFETRESGLRDSISKAVRRFTDERSLYFAQVEQELVHLALAIARKILAREAQLDPMLLTGLVRIALDGMQCGPAARLHVAPDSVAAWQARAEGLSAQHRAEIVADASLAADECMIETDVGSAHLSFERQLKEVEQGFLDLLGRHPARSA